MNRTKDLMKVALHMLPYMEGLQGFYPDKWLLNDDNYALSDKDDFALFETDGNDVHFGHYFCSSRGKKAKDFSLKCIEYMFTETPCKVIKGLTPEHLRGARWMARQLGFTSYGILETSNGPHELFILTKKEWETK